jgi:hypothetical protein
VLIDHPEFNGGSLDLSEPGTFEQAPLIDGVRATRQVYGAPR